MTRASSAVFSARSISPWTELRTKVNPVHKIFSPTAMATIESSGSQPVRATNPTPITTPIDVQTSVSRCLPSATKVSERCLRPARKISQPTAALIDVAMSVMSKPTPTASRACGCRSLSTAEYTMTMAATKIINPSMPAEKYSTLPCP